MPNILFTPSLWEDSGSNSPPSAGLSFAGGEWVWPSLPPQTTPAAASMVTIAATGEGDVVRGYATYQTDAEANCVLTWQLGSGGFDGITLSDGQQELVEFFTNGNTVTVRAYTDSDEDVGGTLVWVPEGDEPEPGPPSGDCTEYGRSTRVYVSGYQRDRIHRSRLVRGERRPLIANFNGAIPTCAVIVSTTWRCDQNQAIRMSNARITDNGRVSAVDIVAQVGDGSRLKCEVTLDDGSTYTQLFYIRVWTAPWFMGENYSFSPGPTVLVATA